MGFQTADPIEIENTRKVAYHFIPEKSGTKWCALTYSDKKRTIEGLACGV
ncbi:hypothetical protein [Brotaphodocola sp.]